MKQVKIGIVGHGFVGKATDNGFEKNVEKFRVDPKLGTSINELAEFKPKLVFICVPTPMNEDGTQDASIIETVIKELVEQVPDAIRVIKSTVLPNILMKIQKFDEQIVYNPEFLREKHAYEDFINSKIIIFGGSKKNSKIVAEIYKSHSDCKTKDYIFTDLLSASLMKYTINTFLASKVIFFNELKNLFDQMNVAEEWENFISVIAKDARIGDSHMNVPGHDGKLGFGGACFPKDSLALIKLADELNIELSVLKTVIKSNNKIRNEYLDLDSRETEQNISFDDKI
jgi:UDPglucose 6-dehydrogenase